ncbi:MAG TPA: protein kinase [Candidatus Eisenbacteria bacterium]|nr:protein kinase [Candidatus Eisenbacteria bacterium]
MPSHDPETRQLESTLSGRYRLEGEIGRGGMAVVYQAHDLRHDRKVAIKVLGADVLRSIGRERFQREIEIAARLNHPHIVPLFDSGEAGESLFYVMPRIEGESLRARLRREPLPVAEAVRLACEIASALDHAHRRGLIHRDVKPDNVLLSEGIALVADFGIARAVRGPAVESGAPRADTMTALIVGTPAYMAPEQAAPGAALDGRADVYSLACVAFEMIAGKPPFEAADPWTLLARHAHDPAPTLESRRPDAPPAVARVIQKALSKRPEDRHPTAAAFGEALRLAAQEGAGITATAASPVAGSLPRPRTSFIGREDDLARCARALEQNRMVTLTGVGGSGKTRLALETGMRVREVYKDGAWWVDFTPITDEGRVADAVADALGILNPQRAPREALLEFAKDRELLLVFDNCEHLVGASGELADAILAASSDSRILATSREGLGVEGEQILAVKPMATPRSDHAADVAEVAGSDAVRLFAERARAVQPAFAVTEANASDVLEICRRLDGIPLAIELAAAHVRLLSVTQIRGRLEDQLTLLTGRGRSLPRHQTLRATLQWSYALLTPEEQRALRHLSVFRGGWTLAAAAEVFGAGESDLLDLLWRLVEKSLVEVVTTEGAEARYRLLEMVRQFAFDALVAASEAERAQARHAEHYLRRLEAEAPRLIGPDEAEVATSLERDLDNLLAALEHSPRLEGGAERALSATADAWLFWVARGHIGLGRDLLNRLLHADSASESLGRAKGLMLSSMLARFAGDQDQAQADAAASVSLHEALGRDNGGLAFALFQRGTARTMVPGQDLGPSRDDFQRGVETARRAGDPLTQSFCFNLLGVIALRQGDHGAAESHFREALALSADRDSPYFQILYESNLADTYAHQGRWDAALRAMLRTTRLTQRSHNRHFAPNTVQTTAVVLAGLGDLATATRLFGAVPAMYAQIGEALDVDADGRRIEASGARPDTEEYRRLYAEGARLGFDQAVSEAVAALERHAAAPSSGHPGAPAR